MRELDILYTEGKAYLESLGYREADKKVEVKTLRVEEFRLNRKGPGSSLLRPDIVILGYSGFTIIELKEDKEEAERAFDQVDAYTKEFAKYNDELPKMHSFGVMWKDGGQLKTKIITWKTHEPTMIDNLVKSGIGKPITNTAQWLRNLRQGFWRGQSYTHIDETLQLLLFAKFWAETNDKPFHIGNFEQIYEMARAEYKASTNVDMGQLPAPLATDPYSYRNTIESIQRVQISADSNIWHLINHLWTKRSLRKEDGQYFTPYAIKRFMCSIYKPQEDNFICDPCGGSGGFIITAADMLDTINQKRFYYYDADGEKIVKVASRAFTTYRHHSGSNLHNINKKSHDSLDDVWDRKMDRIYTNVPFGHKVPKSAVGKNNQSLLKNYDVGRGKASELSQLLFIEKCINQLEDGGLFATVVDKGIVTNNKFKKERAILAKKAALELIVELPGVAFEHFAGTTFPTYLLFFRKGTPSFTRYEKVTNIGYTSDGYIIRNEDCGPFDSCLEEDNYDQCDLAEIEQRWADRNWPAAPDPEHDYAYTTTETGNWLWGYWKYQNYESARLNEVASLVVISWPGKNHLNPTVDRRFRYVKETHLKPKAKTRTLQEGCLLFSRLLSDDQIPSCGIITDKFHGAGCTNENYIIRPDNEKTLKTIWFLINFDSVCHDYLWSHCRGQGRGRIAEADLLDMPIRELSDEEMKQASDLIAGLQKKSRVDEIIEMKLSELVC